MSKSWLAVPISVLTVCSIFTNFTQANAKDTLDPSNAETEMVSKLKGRWSEVGEQGVRLWKSIDENFIRSVLSTLGRQDNVLPQSIKLIQQQTRNLKVLTRPRVNNGNLDAIMSELFRNNSCHGIVSCTVIVQKSYQINDSWEIRTALEARNQLYYLINSGSLSYQDSSQAQRVLYDLEYALSL